LAAIYATFAAEKIPHEIVVVDDGSKDRTWTVLQELRAAIPTLRPTQNLGQHGFGRAVVWGLDQSKGDAVVIMMADASDAPSDAVKYWKLLGHGYDCAFGSRFVSGGEVVDYPRVKLFVNRLANFLVRIGFNIPLNDTTNAFKAYRRTVIDGCRPFLTITPISWHNRKYGEAKLKIKEMGSRYFFICAYVWLEKYFSRGDYRRRS
jgi:dolichol-phosphate mannosyltransferase